MRDGAWKRIVGRLERWREALCLPWLGMVLTDLEGEERTFVAGARDLSAEAPFGARTLTPIGSLTAGFTAVLAAMLVREGRFKWDDPLLRHLKDLKLQDPMLGMRLRVRDLFSHRSGFGRGDLLLGSDRVSVGEVISRLGSAEIFDPDQNYLPSQINYLLAGELVARAAGLPWREVLQRRLLEPLGMESTLAEGIRFRNSPDRAVGYLQPLGTGEAHEPVTFQLPDTAAAATGLYSTLEDLGRWLSFLLTASQPGSDTLLEARDLELLWTGQVPVSPGVGYGMGFKSSMHRGFNMIFHEGQPPGFGASLCLLPELKVGFVLLQGAGNSPLEERVYRDVWDRWLPDVPAAPEVSVTFPDAALEEDHRLAPMHFRAKDDSLTCSIFPDGDRLGLDVPGQEPRRLEGPSQLGIYYSERNQFIGPSLIRMPGNDIPEAMILYHFLTFPGTRLPKDSIPAARSLGATAMDAGQLPGHYHIAHVGQDVEVRLEFGEPVVDIPDDATYDLADPLEVGRWMIEPSRLQGLEFHGAAGGPARALNWKVVQPLEMRRIDLDPPPLEEDEILALRHRAYGRLLEGPACLEIQGQVNYPHQGVTGDFREWICGLDRRQEEDLGGFGTARMLRLGQRMWVSDPRRRELAGGELAAASNGLRLEAALAGVRSETAAFKSLRALTEEKISGRRGIRVWVHPRHGVPQTHWICPDSGHILQTARGLQTVHYEDFRPVDGLEIPFRQTTETAAPVASRRVLEITSARVLPRAPEGVFAMPD